MRKFFRRADRLSKNTSAVITKGKRIRRDYIVLYYMAMDKPALSVVVGKKVGKSHVRNKLKRWIREIFREYKGTLNKYGIVVIVKPADIEFSYAEIRRRVLELWQEKALLS